MTLKRLTFLYIIIFISFLHCFLFSQEGYKVRSIEIIGNHTFSTGTLMDEMNMYSTSGFQKTVFRKDPFRYSEEIIKSDINRLVRFYQRDGFLHVKVQKPELEINSEKNKLDMRIKIHEGEPVLVENVNFFFEKDSAAKRDTTLFPQQNVEEDLNEIVERASPSLKMKQGERFRDQDAKTDQQKLIEIFNNFGYPYAEVFRELKIQENDSTVDIHWYIENGPKCVFGETEVSGGDRISTSLILKNIAFQEGQIFERRLIDKSQQQLYALGVLQIVSVKAYLTPEKNPVIPITVQLQEAPRFTTKAGVGYGSEEKLRLSSDSRLLGLLGGARQLNLFLKHSGLEPYNVDLQFAQPALIIPKSVLSLNLFARKETEPAYTISRKGGSATLVYPLIRNLSGSVSYVYEDVKQDSGSISSQTSAIDESDFQDFYNKSSVILGLKFDNSKPLFYPSQGYSAAFTFKVSGVGFQNTFNYFKLLLDLRHYQGTSTSVIAYRLKIGGIIGYDNNDYIPVEDRFYSGGSSSVRGWGRHLLGPLDSEGIPIGGNSLLEVSVEPRFPIYKSFSGVFFFDAGNVWQESFYYKLDEIRLSWGVGLRYDTPIGPVRLDVARPIFDEETRYQLHFSIGHAF
jgi:outer membrane protein insertion porin family